MLLNNDLDILSHYNFWEGHENAHKGIRRQEYLQLLKSYTKTDSMIFVTGQRRTGKSFILRQLIAQLILTQF